MPSVDSSARLRLIAKACRDAGEQGIMRDLRAGVRVAAQPLKNSVRAAALAQLPKRGGLNVQVASQRVTVSTLAGARTAGVVLRTSAPDTKQTDSGFVRHPTFGNRGRWVRQDIPAAAGWWTKTLEHEGPIAAGAIVKLIDATNARIQSL